MFEDITSGRYSMSGEPWKHVSDDAKDLVRQMLTVDQSKRYHPADGLCLALRVHIIT